MLDKLKQNIEKFRKEYWDPKKGVVPKGNLNKMLGIFVSSIRGFIEDKCFNKASTLTFYSLLSIIPLVAIGFGIAQELGFAEKFIEQVKAEFQEQPQVAEKIIEFSNSTLKRTKGSIIATFGIGVLLWTVISMIGNIATFFDEIWKVKKAPTFWQQIKNYVPMILLFPIFLVGSNSVILFVSSEALLATQSIKLLSIFGPVVQFFFHLVPYILNSLLLSFIYIYLPNIKVPWKVGFIGGFTTGILYSLWQWIYVTFQVHASSYGAIYGSFAAVPLFLIWLNYSWLIVLFGAELSYHMQEME